MPGNEINSKDTIAFAVPAASLAGQDTPPDAMPPEAMQSMFLDARDAVVEVGVDAVERGFKAAGKILAAAAGKVAPGWELAEVTLGFEVTASGSFIVASASANTSVRATFKPKRSNEAQTLS